MKKTVKLPIENDEFQKKLDSKMKDPVMRKLSAKARFRYDYIPIAARLKAAGLSDAALAYVLEVKPNTISSWKERYPDFKAACDNGKELAVQHLVAKGIMAAGGYDFEEETETYRINDEGAEVLASRKVRKKHQKSDPHLLVFMLSNLSKGEWRSMKNVEINEKKMNLNVSVSGEIEADAIRRLAGRLTKKVESKAKDAE
jgi:hypothetical protein